MFAAVVTATIETTPVPNDGDAADDAVVWVHPTDTAKSTVIGTDKDGGIGVYGLDGKQLSYRADGDMNNVDMRYNFSLDGEKVALVTASNRSRDSIAVYKVDPVTRQLENVAARTISTGMDQVYGLTMYQSAKTGKTYTFISDRYSGVVEQWELFDNGSGKVDAKRVRRFDAGGTSEGMVADDETGRLYVAEERGGVWRYGAEADAGSTRTKIAAAGDGRLTRDVEGMAIYHAADGEGYLLISSQGSDDYAIYQRGGNNTYVSRFSIGSGIVDGTSDTDGIEVMSFGLGSAFPNGLFVAQDGSNGSSNQNFKLVPWERIANAVSDDHPLLIDTTQDPRLAPGATPTPTPNPDPVATAPASPADLAAAATSASAVRLAWSDRADNETGFKIERKLGDTGTYAQVASVGANATGWTDSGLKAGTRYVYRVRAFNAAGHSVYSNAGGATTQASPTNPDSPVVYSDPIVITRGGTYRGNWESLDVDTPAVTIKTTEPVIIENSNVRSRGDLIRTATSNTNVTVRNTRGYALNPNVAGETPGRFFTAEYFSNVVLQNNYMEGTGGIKLLNYRGDFSAGNTVKITGNVALNIDGRKSDGKGGFLDFNKRTPLSGGDEEKGYEIRQFVQFDKVAGVKGIEVAWNQVINQPGKSRVEDVINVYKSSGTADSPIRIHDNYIQGAYNVKPWQTSYKDSTYEYDYGYSGGGILLGDGSSGVAYVQAYDNQVVSTTNYGIAIAAGHDSSFYDNRILSSGVLADGRKIDAQNVGAYIWDLYDAGSGGFYNNTGRDNVLGWVNDEGKRNDWWMPDASAWTNNTHWAGTLTHQMEAAEFDLWKDKLSKAGRTVGAV